MSRDLFSYNDEIGGFEVGQHEPLTVRLQGLIRNYPKGVGILKEFIQNADDAGASCIKIYMDWRTHPTIHLSNPDLHILNGPGLLIFNDETFRQDDIESIQKIGIGGKVNRPTKTGRFGLGFNACYNVTDYPCLVTGDSLLWFDPHHKTIPGANLARPGHGWTLSEMWTRYADLLTPFQVAGLQNGSEHFMGTAFRLPLRTFKQAQQSEICSEAFQMQDFEQIMDQLNGSAAELLFFLKHLHSIQIYEIPTETNTPILRLEIETVNQELVQYNRQILLDAVTDDQASFLETIRASEKTLPKVCYDHFIKIRQGGTEQQQCWRISAGIYQSDEDQILESLQEMQLHGEKAVPWAGVAACISREITSSNLERHKNSVHCFLPLPLHLDLPVHINGFFDLDSSRQGLTVDQNLIGKDLARVRWNQVLLEYGVSQAYADLLIISSNDLALSDPDLYCSLFPDSRAALPEFFESLTTQVYRRLELAKVVLADESETLVAIEDLSELPVGWSCLRDPLKNAGWITLPWHSLPKHVLQGFKDAGIDVHTLTPGELRNSLRMHADINTVVESVVNPCLTRLEWVVDLLRFCLSDEPEQDLNGVPLLMLCDGRLHTFGFYSQSNHVFINSSEHERNLFRDFPEWFVDPDFAKATGLVAIPAVKVHKMTPDNVVVNLTNVVKSNNDSPYITWNPDSTTLPNAAWLQELYLYLTAKKRQGFDLEQDTLRAKLKEVPLVPDQFGHLWIMGRATTPLLAINTSQSLLNALDALGIPMISGSKSLVKAVSEFANAFQGFIWEIKPRILVDTMEALANNWHSSLQRYNPEIQDPILDFLSRPEALDDLKTHDRVEALAKLPFFPTEDGQLVSAYDKSCYLPSNYRPPRGTSAEFLLTGQNGRWRNLLGLFDLEELDEPTLIEHIILPKYAELSRTDQYEALLWIHDHINSAETELAVHGANVASKFHETIAAAPLVLCTNGNFHPSNKIYDPESAIVRQVFGDTVPYPDMEFYSRGADAWVRFFKSFGMSDVPQAVDLLEYIDDLVANAKSDGVSSVSDRLVKLFEYLEKQWEVLAKTPVPDSQRQSKIVPFEQALRSRVWLPAQHNRERLKIFGVFQIPEERLYAASELYMPRDGHLIASQRPIAALPRDPTSAMRQALGFPDRPDPMEVMKHFDLLLDRIESSSESGSKPADFATTLRTIYQFFGSSRGTALTDSIPQRYRERNCILDSQEQRLWKPRHCFQQQVNYFEPRRVFIEARTDTLRDNGYSVLGRKSNVAIEDYAEFLRDLHLEYAQEPLPERETTQALHCLSQIDIALSASEFEDVRFPVLTDTNRLMAAAQVYEADAPWFQDRIDRDQVHFLHPSVGRNIIAFARIKPLSRSIAENLAKSPIALEDEKKIRRCEAWQSTIRSSQFRSGLSRLVRSTSQEVDPSTFEWLQTIKVTPTTSIRTELRLEQAHESLVVGTGETNYYFEPEEKTIYIKGQRHQLMTHFLAECFAQQMGSIRLPDKSTLLLIIDAHPSEIDDLLNQLRVPRLQEGLWIEFTGNAFEVEDDTSVEPHDDTPEIDEIDTQSQGINSDLHPQSTGELSEQEHISDQKNTDLDAQGQSTEDEDVFEDKDDEMHSIWARRGEFPKRSGSGHSPHSPTTLRGESDHEGKYPRSGSDELPTDSTSHKQPTKQVQSRLLSYVKSESEPVQHDPTDDERNENLEIGHAAVKLVIEFEMRQGRSAQEMAHNNPGYDILSTEEDGSLRYIEVKGTDGEWDIRGVPVSPTQFKKAQIEKENFWLYVVEFARDPKSARVWGIQNPAEKITQYRFDGGWKLIAEINSASSITPKVGMNVILPDKTQANIIGVASRGPLCQLTLLLPDQSTMAKIYEPGRMILLSE